MSNTIVDTPRDTDQASLPPHLSAVQYQAEQVALYYLTLIRNGIDYEHAMEFTRAYQVEMQERMCR